MAARSVEEVAGEFSVADEREWQRLRRQFELAADPWLGFVFCPAQGAAAVLRQRTEFMLRYRAKQLRCIVPGSPTELKDLMPRLFEILPQAECVWVEAIAVDGPLSTDEVGPWAGAWDWLMLRLNERRDALRRRLKGALVFAVHPSWKPEVRDAAPDLWSVRSLVLDFAGRKSGDQIERLPASELTSGVDDDADYAADVQDALAAVRRLAATSSPDPRSLGRLHMRAANALLATDRAGDAARHAEQALVTLQGQSMRLRAQALMVAGRVKQADNDVGAARHHLEEAVDLWRSMLDEKGETPQGLRDLSVSLGGVGDIHRSAGELAAAKTAYEESLALRRRLLETTGETPHGLRDLSVSLNKVGDVHRSAGHAEAAEAAYGESLALRRRLLETTGETPQGLRDLSVSLDNVGDVHRSAGDAEAAEAAYGESLALCRRLLETMGETPEGLRDLSVSLGKVGDIRRSAGDMTAAKAAWQESLAIDRRLVGTMGETPQSLRDLSISLSRIGDLHEASGDMADAKAAHDESSALRRRLDAMSG